MRVFDVRSTKLIDFERIASRFLVNMGLYKSINQSVWKLGFGNMHHRRSLPNIGIGLYQGHYIKNLDGLANHLGAGCKQRSSHHDNYNRHFTKMRCTGGQPKLMCDSGKFKNIMNSSEKVFYGGNYAVPETSTVYQLCGCKWHNCPCLRSTNGKYKKTLNLEN